MTSEHARNEAPGASSEAKAGAAATARAVRDALHEGLVVAVATAFRVGDAVAAATDRPRESARSLLSAVAARAGRIAAEASAMARRGAEATTTGVEAPAPDAATGARRGARPKRRRAKSAKRS